MQLHPPIQLIVYSRRKGQKTLPHWLAIIALYVLLLLYLHHPAAGRQPWPGSFLDQQHAFSKNSFFLSPWPAGLLLLPLFLTSQPWSYIFPQNLSLGTLYISLFSASKPSSLLPILLSPRQPLKTMSSSVRKWQRIRSCGQKQETHIDSNSQQRFGQFGIVLQQYFTRTVLEYSGLSSCLIIPA